MTVVGIGASAGGLEASRRLVASLPSATGMAFILVQHLDPTHDSMMVELLADHTNLVVRQIDEGMRVEGDHVYVIPPGVYLSIEDDVLHLSKPVARHGARLPFDHLLQSMAKGYGARAACVVLSGTGADGAIGLAAIKAQGGLVIVQDPAEAGYDGMPRSAMQTGLVDMVLPVARIPEALMTHFGQMPLLPPPAPVPGSLVEERLPDIIARLRQCTRHDFSQYKEGTLTRRVERRMAVVQNGGGDVDAYLKLLATDDGEADQLARDLLIHVTGFFRDPRVFDLLASEIVPEMVRRQPVDQPLRIWIAGCSTGEEAYSLAILFREAVIAEGREVRLQIFASDIDPDSVATARDGVYPAAIADAVSPQRLARWFTQEGDGYHVVPELRSAVVFTVHDVLTDPPFSRLHFISCRNLLIYLRPDAQAHVISLFHFALRAGGLLLLGNAEAIADNNARFEERAKAERIFRHTGGNRRAELTLSRSESTRPAPRSERGPVRSRQTVLADLVQRLIMQGYAPAAVLVNLRHECLYSVGPIDRFLRVAPGDPSNDVLAMARHHMQGRLRTALRRAVEAKAPVVAPGGQTSDSERPVPFTIAVQPVQNDADTLLLICFIEEHPHAGGDGPPLTAEEGTRVAELERELEATRIELQGAMHNLDLSVEEQKAINEEALSVNEELQSSNEELLTSKEELQSLNEELTALNTELQESLARKRVIANDLQNVLNSTNVATILLDTELRIRIFTPSARALFNVIASDVGRSLSDLTSLAFDADLLPDAGAVLRQLEPIEREIETHTGQWFIRRAQPYRTLDGATDGVVITFVDATERKNISDALQLAKRQAEMATAAKSRFVAAASHDLRQPLQTMMLLHGLLTNGTAGTKMGALVSRLGDTLTAMSGMLNTLLDLNQIEVGALQPELTVFSINDLLTRLRDEFAYVAHARGLDLRVVASSALVRSDPRLLEQLMRNLLSNAVKYTPRGKILVGCRRCGDALRLDVIDTGIGIPEAELAAIFDEYHQVNNPARERSRGLGLGLSIVQQLSKLLGHKVEVRSELGRGSMFSVEIQRSTSAEVAAPAPVVATVATPPGIGTVLVVEDDPELLELMELTVSGEGYQVFVAANGPAAMELVKREKMRPDLLLTDYNMPGDMDGLQLAEQLRRALRRPLPAIVLTGDTSTRTLREIAGHDCVHLHKPARLAEMVAMIYSLLPPKPVAEPESAPTPAPEAIVALGGARVHVVDDDRIVREEIRTMLRQHGIQVEDYASAEAFLAAYRPQPDECLLLDIYLPGMSGLQLLSDLRRDGHGLPVVMITGKGDVAVAVQAMKAGALDFIEKPVSLAQLLSILERALTVAHDTSTLLAWRDTASHQVDALTPRQREIMDMVLAGHPSKNIAADLGISQRTVENHRAAIMRRTETRSLPALARLALAASGREAAAPSDPAAPRVTRPPTRRS